MKKEQTTIVLASEHIYSNSGVNVKMSFLSSMQQYVTSGISSLGLGNRRFSLSRQESSEHQSQSSSTSGTSASTLQLSGALTPCPTPGLQSSGSSSIFNVVAPTVGSSPGSSSATNYPPGGVVIGNPNATNPLLGKSI